MSTVDYEKAWRELHTRVAEQLSASPQKRFVLRWMAELEREPAFYELQASDVGQGYIRAWGKPWPVVDILGHIQRGDVGKRVFFQGLE